MKILITDITDMSQGKHCVAGWCEEERRMIRPLPNNDHWPVQLLVEHDIEVGSIITVHPTGKAHIGAYPHTSEDLNVVMKKIVKVASVPSVKIIELVNQTSKNLSQAFEGNLKLDNIYQGTAQKLWVPTGTRCPSLVSINRPAGSIRIFKNNYGSLRARINSEEGVCNAVEVAVASSLIKRAFREQGCAGAESVLPASVNWHLRLGLAREFNRKPGECALMLNGVL